MHPKDVPFALLYYADENDKRDSVRMRFAGAIGVPDNHETTPEVIWLNDVHPPREFDPRDSPTASTASTFGGATTPDPGWGFAEVLSSRQTAVVNCSELVADYTPRAWDMLPTQAFVIPVVLNSDEGVPGAVLVVGISPQLELEASYEMFTEE